MYVNGQWAVTYVHATNLHTLIFMSATADMAMGSGLWQNTVSKLKHRWGTQTQKQLNKNHPLFPSKIRVGFTSTWAFIGEACKKI